MMFAVSGLAVVTTVLGHASLLAPLPRNAVDRNVPGYIGGHFGNATCAHPGPMPPSQLPPDAYGPVEGNKSCWGCNCVNGSQPCNAAQTCVWFTEGTSIGCAVPDGKGSTPNYKDRCNSGKNATNNDPYYRTMAVNVTALSNDDIYRWNPWRAPGNAPVWDPCGMAGGAPVWVSTALSFYNTTHARQGDLGSRVLPPTPTGVVWQAGATIETKWAIRANHGGGYQYRLCPKSEELTEDCMQKNPIPFAGRLALEWANGSRTEIQGRYLATGTTPLGSTWSRNPIPYSHSSQPPEFDPPCAEDPNAWKTDTGVCSGRYLVNMSIIDWLTIPPSTPAGEYILGFRYDCEESAQIWTSCADVTIVA